MVVLSRLKKQLEKAQSDREALMTIVNSFGFILSDESTLSEKQKNDASRSVADTVMAVYGE